MRNKFKIRNLTNELRHLEKKRQEIEDELEELTQIRNSEVLLEGDMKHSLSFKPMNLSKYTQDGANSDDYRVKIYKYANKTVCELTWIRPITKRKEIYVGEAICHPDDTYDSSKGMNIALLKALKQCYEHRINSY